MGLTLVTPGFTNALRRSKARASGVDILTGRWVALDASGRVILPGARRLGLYLALEGNINHIGGTADFGSSPFASTKTSELPSAVASNEVALVFGSMVYEVGPEGCDPTAALNIDVLVATDNFGRLVIAAGEDTAIGIVEARLVDGGGLTTKLTVRTFGQ